MRYVSIKTAILVAAGILGLCLYFAGCDNKKPVAPGKKNQTQLEGSTSSNWNRGGLFSYGLQNKYGGETLCEYRSLSYGRCFA